MYRHPRRVRAILLFATLLITLPHASIPTVLAQPIDTLPEPRKMFGVGDDEFFIGGWSGVLPPTCLNIQQWLHRVDDTTEVDDRVMTPVGPTAGNPDSLWSWCQSMGIDVVRRQIDWAGFPDTRLDASALRQGRRLILAGSGIIDEAGWGAEATFYFTDSIRFREEPTAFARRSGGADRENDVERSDLSQARDQVYETTNTSAEQVVADHPAFRWRSTQPYRWEWHNDGAWIQRPDSAIQNSDYFFRRPHDNHDTTYWINLEGHLFDGGSAADTATLLWIEIWYEVPRNATRMTWNGTTHVATTATTNDTILIHRRGVTKQELTRINEQTPWDQYRDVSYAFAPRFCANGTTGPLFGGNSSRSIDIKVRWTGAEAVALHSLALRDSIGQLVMSDDQTYMAALRARAGAMIYRNTGATRLPSVIAVSLAGEELGIQAAPVARVYKWIREWMNNDANPTQFTPAPTVGADSLPGWVEEGQPEAMHRIYDLDFVSSEGAPIVKAWMTDLFGAPHYTIPSLAEHNGGHFTADSMDQ